jgi:antitoxin HicB
MEITMTATYRVVRHPDEGGYAVVVPALPGCFSQGGTVEEALGPRG